MRYLLILLVALPAYAQAPGRQIKFACQDGYCILAEADWRWVMEASNAKDKEIKQLREAKGCGPWRDM